MGSRSRFYLMLVALAAALMAPVLATGPVAAQTVKVAATTGVQGNSYTSPVFGFSVTWDDTWTVGDEQQKEGYTLLQLSNGTSIVTFEGSATSLDPKACLNQVASNIEGSDSVSGFKPATGNEGPLGGDEDGRSWAVFDFTFKAQSGDVDYSAYLDCRTVVPNESVVVITQLVPAASFNDQIDPLLALLNSLTISGNTGTSGDSGNTGDTGNTGSNQTDTTPVTNTGDLSSFILITGKDVENFWKRELPIMAPGHTYTALKDIVPFDSTVNTGCGPAKPGEVGPFYCPPDQTIYYDLTFGEFQLQQFNGDRSVVAVALAHEMGHHVQNVMGWRTCEQTPCMDPSEMTSLEVENQADCFAGAWTADAEGRGRLGSTDVEKNIVQFAALLGSSSPGAASADPGAHGKGALRTFWFLNGYYRGVTECLTVSAATDPAQGGAAAPDQPTPTPTDVATEEPSNTTFDVTPTAALKMGESYTVELPDFTAGGQKHTGESLTISMDSTDLLTSIDNAPDPNGQYLVVYFSLTRDGTGALGFDYSSLVLVDSNGNQYDYDAAATDALLKTAFENGESEQLDAGATYNLAIAFDVPADASGFTIMASDGSNPVELDR